MHTPYLRPGHDWDDALSPLSPHDPRQARADGGAGGHRVSNPRRAAADTARYPRALSRPERGDLRTGQPWPARRGVQAGQPQPGRAGPLPRGRRGAPRAGDADGHHVGMDRGRFARPRRLRPSPHTPASVRHIRESRSMRESSRSETRLPARSPRLFRLFRWYGKRYVARHFHAVRISRSGPVPDLPRRPTIVVLNHPSWWDPLICVILSEVHARLAGALRPDRVGWSGPVPVPGPARLLRVRYGYGGRREPVPADQPLHPVTSRVGPLADGPGRVRRRTRAADGPEAGYRAPGPSARRMRSSCRWPSSIRSGSTDARKS